MIFNFIRNRIAEHKTIRELSRMTNRELADIGISRPDIRMIARKNDLY